MKNEEQPKYQIIDAANGQLLLSPVAGSTSPNASTIASSNPCTVSPDGTIVSKRVRRVACSCPNCKDTDGR